MKYLFLLLLPIIVYSQNKGMVPVKPNGLPERRLALVIGNKDYSTSPLKNPLNDADDISAVLRSLGFTVLTYKNLDRISLEEVIDKFSVELKNYDVGLFYYSGHGIQAQGETFIIPTDVKELEAEARVRYKCVNLGSVLSAFEGADTKTSLVFLDACRNNPFKKGWSKSFDKQGLSIPAYNPAGNIVVYATDAGSTADDNPSDRNGLFTKCLLKHISTPNLTLNTILNKTRQEVQKINPKQYPKEYGGLLDDFYFIQKAMDNSELELERKKRKMLERKLADLESKTSQTNTVIPQKNEQTTRKYLDLPFAEMIRIPGGTFEMGDTRNEGETYEKPIHSVKLDGFYMGKYEVTQRQWESIMGSNPSYFKDCPDCPVEQVSWEDVQEFLKKLNSRTGSNYRLPTESEWEYAAGGGANKRTRFSNGMDILESSGANFNAKVDYVKDYSRSGDYREKTIKVGSFQSNGLGLYDMTGNVWEWCSDWYGNYSTISSLNPKGPATGTNRVLRGGSWNGNPQNGRVANRHYRSPTNRSGFVGFRVVLSQ